jgi:hypothetical protein
LYPLPHDRILLTLKSLLQALYLASRAGEFHPHALLETYVNLSIHTAPDVQVIDGLLALASSDRTCRDRVPTFAATLTTAAFDDRSLQWFEAHT